MFRLNIQQQQRMIITRLSVCMSGVRTVLTAQLNANLDVRFVINVTKQWRIQRRAERAVARTRPALARTNKKIELGM